MHLLPIELIVKIFTIAYDDYRLGVDDENGTLQFSLSISSVCSFWRAITLSTPGLWTCFIIQPRQASIDPTLPMLKTLLERSGEVPLDIHLIGHVSDEDTYVPSLISSWELASTNLYRCRKLQVTGLRRKLHRLIFPLIGPLERLETLRITSFSRFDGVLSEPVFDTHEAAPNISEISLSGIDFSSLTTVPTTSLNRLMLIYSYPIRWSTASSFLTSSSSLTHLKLHLPALGQLPSIPIFLPNLLSLLGPDCRYDRLVLAPRLEHLGCVNFNHRMEYSRLPSLKRLTMDSPSPSALTSWRLNSWVNDIDTLRLINCYGTKFILDLLLVRLESHLAHSVFPSLRTLILKDSGGSPNTSRADISRSVLRVLDDRPLLCLQCEPSLFMSAEFDWSELRTLYGTRLSKIKDPLVAEWC